MKFGKSLSNQIEKTLPQWRDKFLSYKELKKKLKLVKPAAPKHGEERPTKRARLDGDMSKEETDFRNSLEHELHKFNTFFVEKEEECIIKLKELQDRVAKVKDSNEQLMQIRKEIVDFHGEMVLLENYSALNYTGLVKILKKYDKRTGALIRLPFIQKVLQQPFFTTDLLYKLVKECETMLDHLFPANDPSTCGEATPQAEGCDPSTSASTKSDGLLVPKELAAIQHIESLHMKSTISALHALQEIRKGSSTVSMFSLPPLQISGLEETWNKIPILEQTANLYDVDTKRENPTLQGPVTRGRLRRIQEEVQHELTTLKDLGGGHEGPTVYCVTNCLEGNSNAETLKCRMPNCSWQRLIRFGFGRDESDTVSAKFIDGRNKVELTRLQMRRSRTRLSL
ncbi:SPX domain-containing protein 1 [Mucuna pruriens]|uniref:SPX domain-containing protein 1 n=1 Tax=Mucuna pruriens TaxID=157652 RepID=A0A371G5U8_MUCPR|nr:SPX domain-containing protein 1 [Mucuna pruriens]